MNNVVVPLQPLNRGVEQMVARRAHNPKVVGSSPASATKKACRKTGFSNLQEICSSVDEALLVGMLTIPEMGLKVNL